MKRRSGWPLGNDFGKMVRPRRVPSYVALLTHQPRERAALVRRAHRAVSAAVYTEKSVSNRGRVFPALISLSTP
jgi:hypothetical protein